MEIQTFNKLSLFGEITNNSIKTIIINYLYQYIKFNNIKYELLNELNQLEPINNNDFYITPHIMGVNCIIVFMEHEKRKYQCIINKKDIKYYQNQINVNQLKMYNFWIDHSIKDLTKLYPATVFDGKFILNNNELNYIINDVYIYNGYRLFNKIVYDKFQMINNIIDLLNTNIDKFTFKFASLYEIDSIDDLIYNKIKNSKLKINGIIFLPKLSGKQYIFINDHEFSLLKNKNDNINLLYKTLEVPSIPKNMSNDYQLDKELINEIVFKKTSIPDVFELFNYIIKDKLYLNINKDNRIGIAHIPDIKTSHYCKQLANTNELFLNKCIYNNKFKKWMPQI